VTSPQLNQVNTLIQNIQIRVVGPSFEVSPTPLANSPICNTCPTKIFGGLTSPQLNQVNTLIQNMQINVVAPSFEVSRTPLANSPICGTSTIEMS
jgi:hypothetical protein